MNSNVGFPNIYEAQDQQNYKKSEMEYLRRRTGENIQGFLPKDQTDEMNRLRELKIQRKQAERMKDDPTYPAMLHGNKPNKGAIIDKELQEEDEAMIRKMKGDAMPGKKY